MDKVIIKMAYGESINLPIELFEKLPKQESDALREILMEIYFDNNPQVLSDITAVSGGDIAVLDTKKEEIFQQVMEDEYSFQRDILEEMDDEIALMLVNKIDDYNIQGELPYA